MKRLHKLSSILFLLLAFIYPPALVEAKESPHNQVLPEQSVESQTNSVTDETGEILLARRYRESYYGRRRARRHYYKRRYHHRGYYRRYRRGRYSGQYYRNGEWQVSRDRYGRLMYDWQRDY